MNLSPAVIGVGFLLGYRNSAVCVAGSLLSSMVFIPLIAWLGEGSDRAACSRDKSLRHRGYVGLTTSGNLMCVSSEPGPLPRPEFLPVPSGTARHVCRVSCRVAKGVCRHHETLTRTRARRASPDETARKDRDLPVHFHLHRDSHCRASAGARALESWAGKWSLVPRMVCAVGVSLFSDLLLVAVTARIVGIVGVSFATDFRHCFWSPCLASPRSSLAAGWTDIKRIGRPCSRSARSWLLPPPNRAIFRKTSRLAFSSALCLCGSSLGNFSARPPPVGQLPVRCCCCTTPTNSAEKSFPCRRPRL